MGRIILICGPKSTNIVSVSETAQMNNTVHDGEHGRTPHDVGISRSEWHTRQELDRCAELSLPPRTRTSISHGPAVDSNWQHSLAEDNIPRPFEHEYIDQELATDGLRTKMQGAAPIGTVHWQPGFQSSDHVSPPVGTSSAATKATVIDLRLKESERGQTTSLPYSWQADEDPFPLIYYADSRSVISGNDSLDIRTPALLSHEALESYVDDVYNQPFPTPELGALVSRTENLLRTLREEFARRGQTESLEQRVEFHSSENMPQQMQGTTASALDENISFLQRGRPSSEQNLVPVENSLGNAPSIVSESYTIDAGKGPATAVHHHADQDITFRGLDQHDYRAWPEDSNPDSTSMYPDEDGQHTKPSQGQDARNQHHQKQHSEPPPSYRSGRRQHITRFRSKSDQHTPKTNLLKPLLSSRYTALSDGSSGLGSLGPYVAPYTISGPQNLPHRRQDASLSYSGDVSAYFTNQDESMTEQDRSLICTLCESTFHRPADLRRHMHKHENPQYACEACDKRFYRMDKLRDHVWKAHKGKVVTTPQGGLEFDVPPEATTSTSKTFVCTVCGSGKTFLTPGALTKHVNRRHVRRYPCNQCEKKFNLGADLKRHQASVHKRHIKMAYTCRDCTKTFSRRDNFLRHAKKYEHALEESQEC
jgi:hypothetical protein